MNYSKEDIYGEQTIGEWLENVARNIESELIGLWNIVSAGR